MVTKIKGKPMEFSFLNIVQYGTLASVSRWGGFFLLCWMNFMRSGTGRTGCGVKAQDLLRLLANASERLSRKDQPAKGELARSEDQEHLRVCGDLINANLYRIEREALFADLENFYDENRLMRVGWIRRLTLPRMRRNTTRSTARPKPLSRYWESRSRRRSRSFCMSIRYSTA